MTPLAFDDGTPKRELKVPSLYIYMVEMLETLRAFGGAATSDEVCDWFIERGIARPADVNTIQKQGETRFRKEVRFARLALAQAGLLGGNKRGYWCLSPEGWGTALTVETARLVASRRNRKSIKASPHGDCGEADGLPGPTRGPAPVIWEGLVQRDPDQPTSTYVMRFGGSSVWKIGYASNATARLAEVNRHVPIEVVRSRWTLVREHRWPEARLAFEMEQRLLQILSARRTTGERVNCTECELDRAWKLALA